MTAPLLLLLLAVGLTTLGPRVLLAADWPLNQPSWGIWAWQSLTATVAWALILGGLTLAVPVLPGASHIGDLVRTTHLDVTDHYETPAGTIFAVGALVATVALVINLTRVFLGVMLSSRQHRRMQLETLALIGRPHPEGYTVVDLPIPLVYSVPGHGGAIVVTTAALAALGEDELRSALSHERRHLRARHDLALMLTEVLRRAFHDLPFFATAHAQIEQLVEMQADDAAQGVGQRAAMAGALTTFVGTAGPDTPTAASAGRSRRIRRLVDGDRHRDSVRLRVGVGVGLATSALLVAPIGLAFLPALGASKQGCCDVAVARPTTH
ncbi:M56 family metallopeptidase [Nocardioides sp. Y6]|uniref:M56 family metallopeptidase n=1 Tax=Nocardioides malaquae TaxID=2773426 RepID=A0ABR9RT03_9ACTN|nr:M56 family metallopeptidase [Nocardioides malaquae]MBE7324270.1 M56 family metallopeptidase [Nocardioides malaquae]